MSIHRLLDLFNVYATGQFYRARQKSLAAPLAGRFVDHCPARHTVTPAGGSCHCPTSGVLPAGAEMV